MTSSFYRDDVRFLAMVAGVAAALFLLCATLELGSLAMRKIKLAALAFTALGLAACGTLGDGAVTDKALGNLEHCKRTYQASIGALGAPSGSLYIECPAKPFDGQ